MVPRGPRRAARIAGKGERFWFRPGRGKPATRFPNGWQSIFGGPGLDANARTGRQRPASGTSTCSRPSSPTSTGPTPRSGRARGRPPLLVRPWRRGCADRLGGAARQGPGLCRRDRRQPAPGEHPYTDRDALHEIYRRWRAVADSYPTSRASSSGRSGCPDIERFAKYLRPDELHTAFNFDFLARPWDAPSLMASRSTPRWPRTRLWAPRRRGSSRTTTSPAR